MNEYLRPWKLFSLACGIALLIIGAFHYDAPDWDIPISLIMALLSYLTASLSLYWMCGLVWYFNGSLAELLATARRTVSGDSRSLHGWASGGREPFSPAEAKAHLLAAFERDIALHAAGEYFELGATFDEFEARYPRGGGEGFVRLVFALEFWASWIDASEHDWQFYPPIREDDWPRFAKIVAADLAADRTTTEPVLVELFSPRKG